VRPEDGFRFDLDALERLVTPHTKLIVINTPHNPTGSMLTAEELRRVYALAEAAGAWVLCDEAYRWLEVPGGPPLPGPMRDLGPRAISVGTFSKPFGLPGIRTGWIAAPADVVAACWGLRDYTSLSPTKLSDALAVIALRGRDRIVERTRGIVSRNLAAAQAWATAHEDLVAWRPPQGGLLSLMRYAFDVPSLELANRLAEEYGVMLAPGSAFGYEGYLRLGIGQEPTMFADGLTRAGRCFDDLLGAGVRGSPGLLAVAAASNR
jgi:aspartate/methionine/tyrosine aminotransferase